MDCPKWNASIPQRALARSIDEHFLSLKKAMPEQAQELFDETKRAAQRRYASYVRKTQEDWSLPQE